ncbi:MAG: hypothetical protein NTY90_05285 [Candidatus Micrarchaeota archaeon]|nr:hypothetical protein [Candidatus Micrarchaeota archaeon]
MTPLRPEKMQEVRPSIKNFLRARRIPLKEFQQWAREHGVELASRLRTAVLDFEVERRRVIKSPSKDLEAWNAVAEKIRSRKPQGEKPAAATPEGAKPLAEWAKEKRAAELREHEQVTAREEKTAKPLEERRFEWEPEEEKEPEFKPAGAGRLPNVPDYLASKIVNTKPNMKPPEATRVAVAAFVGREGRNGVDSLIQRLGHEKVLPILKHAFPDAARFRELTNHLPARMVKPVEHIGTERRE